MTENTGKKQIRSFAERLARMEEERLALVSDIREIRAEAKQSGFNTKALNLAVKRLRMSASEREEADQFEMELHMYYDAVEGGDE